MIGGARTIWAAIVATGLAGLVGGWPAAVIFLLFCIATLSMASAFLMVRHVRKLEEPRLDVLHDQVGMCRRPYKTDKEEGYHIFIAVQNPSLSTINNVIVQLANLRTPTGLEELQHNLSAVKARSSAIRLNPHTWDYYLIGKFVSSDTGTDNPYFRIIDGICDAQHKTYSDIRDIKILISGEACRNFGVKFRSGVENGQLVFEELERV